MSCNCKEGYFGLNCEKGDYHFQLKTLVTYLLHRYLHISECNCGMMADGKSCNQNTGQCACKSDIGGLKCTECQDGFYNYPVCRSE